MILGIEVILSIVFYERKKIIFYGKNLELTKNNTANNVFLYQIFPYYRLSPIFQK